MPLEQEDLKGELIVYYLWSTVMHAKINEFIFKTHIDIFFLQFCNMNARWLVRVKHSDLITTPKQIGKLNSTFTFMDAIFVPDSRCILPNIGGMSNNMQFNLSVLWFC